MKNKINIAVIGATGVGKSTLIKYLLPNLINKPEARAGKPVTVKGFHLYEGVIEGTTDNEKRTISVNCYDSWGLEVDKYDEWMQDLKDALNARDVDKSPNDWFHSIFYLIDASGSRVQENDIKLIKLLREQKCRINVIFSKSDLVSEEESKQLHAVLKEQFNDSIYIADICSEGKKTRSGYHDPFGKTDMLKFMIKDFMMIMVDRMPSRFKVNIDTGLKKYRSTVEALTLTQISWFTANEDAGNLRRLFDKDIIPKLHDLIIQEIKKINNEMDVFLGSFKIFISTVGLDSSIKLEDFDIEFKTLYNGIFGDDPGVCIDFSDYVWTLGKFISKLNPLIIAIDYANNFINRGERQREGVLKSWNLIENEVKKISEQIAQDIEFKLESAVKKIE